MQGLSYLQHSERKQSFDWTRKSKREGRQVKEKKWWVISSSVPPHTAGKTTFLSVGWTVQRTRSGTTRPNTAGERRALTRGGRESRKVIVRKMRFWFRLQFHNYSKHFNSFRHICPMNATKKSGVWFGSYQNWAIRRILRTSIKQVRNAIMHVHKTECSNC